MADDREDRGREKPTTSARDRRPFLGIGVTGAAAVIVLVLLLALFGAFDREEETLMDEADNTMLGGSVTGGAGMDAEDEEIRAVIEGAEADPAAAAEQEAEPGAGAAEEAETETVE